MQVKENTKHCRTCNKCVEGFDHHCSWLNNCIGRKNYKFFFHLVTSAMISYAFMIAVQVKCLVTILGAEE